MSYSSRSEMEERHKISVSNEAPQLELEADEMNASRLSQLRLVGKVMSNKQIRKNVALYDTPSLVYQ